LPTLTVGEVRAHPDTLPLLQSARFTTESVLSPEFGTYSVWVL
jgi:hypothetical protein